MSFSNKDRKIHAKDGNKFPVDPPADTETTFATVIADALRRDFGSTPAHVKHIARLTGANMRTVGNWLSAKNGPNGSSLVVLMRHSDEITMAVLKLSEREDLQCAVSEKKSLKELRSAITAALKHLPPD